MTRKLQDRYDCVEMCANCPKRRPFKAATPDSLIIVEFEPLPVFEQLESGFKRFDFVRGVSVGGYALRLAAAKLEGENHRRLASLQFEASSRDLEEGRVHRTFQRCHGPSGSMGMYILKWETQTCAAADRLAIENEHLLVQQEIPGRSD